MNKSAKKKIIFIFSSKNCFLFIREYFFFYKIGLTLIDVHQICPMKPSEHEISFPVESYDKKKIPAENCRNVCVVKKHIVTRL